MKEYRVICDISGAAEAETHRIQLDDRILLIDLAKPEFDKLSKYLDKYFAAGTVQEKKPTNGSNGGDPELQRIREWAAAHGLQVSPKGRISQDVMNAYQAAIKAAEAEQATVPAEQPQQQAT